MTKTPALRLVGIALVAGLAGHGLSLAFASRGAPVPVAGIMPGIVFLVLSAIVLALGLRVKRYLDESRERARTHPLTPRKHQLDMVVAYRILIAARAAAYTGGCRLLRGYVRLSRDIRGWDAFRRDSSTRIRRALRAHPRGDRAHRRTVGDSAAYRLRVRGARG